ncbi:MULTISPECIES: COR domain-containing protein [unclassified Microcoleus]|uniref:leucine-rich repeat domain-containing protein n=1 Tax=unclassified Microcoleus TaxID=2642155 RepID=UPI002FD58E9D
MTLQELLQLIDKAAEEGSTELDLAGLELEELPPEIGKCTQLETLVLGKFDEKKGKSIGNKLTEFPDVVLQLTNLKRLLIADNQITVIPDAIGQLSNLRELNLSDNHISVIPDAIGQLSNLTRLDLNSNQITVIPEDLGQLSNLSELSLSSNQITCIPEDLAQLSNLTWLDLSSNQITCIPEDLAQLSNLTLLHLGGNQITVIPEVIAQLSNLLLLHLGGNQITVIPEVIAQLSNLTSLLLRDNQITVIPEDLAQLSNLTQLFLDSNQITVIPEDLGQLSNLTELSLGDNQITVIPEDLAQLSNLTWLNLGDNQITSIPDVIGQISNLTVILLHNNQITSIPEAIRGMEELGQLHFPGNPLPIPPSILQGRQFYEAGDLRTILDFYFQTRNPDDTEELYEAKLLIVGEGEAGKTTLAKKLLNPDYELRKREPSTEGIDVLRWEFPHNGKSFRVHIWDFGGQEIYHATHQFFLTERSFYILLVDNRRENPNLCYWLNVIELLSNASPVLLVHNEKHDIRCEINVSQLRGDFANLKESLNTNLADNRGLDELQRYLVNNITQLKHVGIGIPKRWASVRHVLENYAHKRTNYIEVSEFYDICAQQGFDKSDKPAMLSLSKYLHDLGIILHFQKNSDNKKSILLNWVILRPEWATNAVYKVTDNEQVIANCGYFTDENLSEIWSEEEYDNLHDELLQLMKNFKLCATKSRPGHYIAPQRLPVEKPDYPWDDTDNLIVRYEYTFMPKGIITSLIVQMHDLIEDIVWREGVVLTDGCAKAEVIENYHKKEICIRVSGT